MGQKINPNIFRLGINKMWKTEFFEKKSDELPLHTFKDLEIREYIERFFEIHGIILHDYKQQYSKSSLNLYISYFVTSDYNVVKEQTSTITMVDKSGNKKRINLNPTVKKLNSFNFNPSYFQQFEKADNYYILKKYLELNNVKKPKLSQANQQFSKQLDLTSKSQNSNSVLNKMFKTLSLFMGNEAKINVHFCCINKDLSFLKNTQKKNFILLQKFRNTLFLKEGLELLFYVTCSKNSANLLTKFIALQIQKIKRQKFFLSFLKQSLTAMLNSTVSQVKGIKIILKGRLNGVPRAKHKIIVIGDVPVQSISEKIDYAQTTIHNSNGSYGIKVWVVEK